MTKLHRMAFLFAVLVVTGSFALAVAQESVEKSSTEQELDDLRYRIKHTRRRAEDLAKDEKQQLARIHALEEEASLTRELLSQLGNKETGIRAEIERLQFELADAEERVVTRRSRLSERLRSMYMRPRWSMVATALASDDLGQFGARLRVMTHVARTERALISEVQRAQSDKRIRRAELSAQMAEINITRSETEDRRLQLERLTGERQGALADVRAERARFESSVSEMERAAESMQKLLAELEQRRLESDRSTLFTNFAGAKGSLPWPAEGTVLKPYGRSVHPKFKTVVMNKGMNIGAAMGTPIRCVASGRVEYVDWLPGYGKCIIVDHGDGYYTLYAHASVIFPRVGADVGAGEVLGEVGDTGSLNGTQLYFEVRKGKDSLDPASWLSQR